MAEPETAETVLSYWIGAKLPVKSKGNLLKLETQATTTARTTVQAEVSSTVTTGEALAAKYAKNRPKHRQSTINKAWENAVNNSLNGKVYDPNTGELLNWDKFKKRQGQWDMGHKPEFKYSKELQRLKNGEITEEEFLKNYHNSDNYRPEDPSSNRSRKHD